MTDRELLEAAAKAAGLPFISGCFDEVMGLCVSTGADDDQEWWDPLTDDGDALRLAVKLNIDAGKPGMRLSVDWGSGDDPYAATRRAIVRAAAASTSKE